MKQHKKKILLVLAILVVVGLLLKIFVFKKDFYYAGTIEATKVDVPSRVASVIASLEVKEGDIVQEQQILLNMKCEDIALDAALAEKNYARVARLFRQGVQAQEAYDRLLYTRDLAKLRQTWCRVASPLAGTVLSKYHEPGEMVGPGTVLFTLANLKDVYAYLYIPQPQIAELKLGQKITGYLPELNMREFTGTITQIGQEAEFTPKNVQTRDERERLVYAVKVSFQNDEQILKPGMTLEVKLDK